MRMTNNHKNEEVNQELYEQLCAMDARLREHDENFIGFGNLYVEMNHKLNTIIRQTRSPRVCLKKVSPRR